MLASGIMGVSGSGLKAVAVKGGAGAIVTQSISIAPREGHKNPTIYTMDDSLISAFGLPNQGYLNYREEIEQLKDTNVPVVASVYGYGIEEYVEVAKAMEEFGASAIELNLAYPNAGKTGSFYGQSKHLTYEVVRAVKSKVKIPVFAKLTANVTDIVSIAKACEEAKADAIVAIGPVGAMKIDIYAKKPVLANKTGGLSGKCLKPIAVRCVYEIAKEVDIDIIGCGGVFTGEDAVEYFLAGAKAVQIGTAVLYRGIRVFKKVCREIESYLKSQGYSSLEEIIGLAL